MKRILAILLLVLLAFLSTNAQAVDPWNDGDFRDLQQKLGGWTVPNRVALSGNTYVVDLKKSNFHVLDTVSATGGVSIAFTGTSAFPTRAWVAIPGNGYAIEGLSGSGFSPIAYPSVASSLGAWPFPTKATSNANRVYLMEVVTGVNTRDNSGATVYVLSGVTLY